MPEHKVVRLTIEETAEKLGWKSPGRFNERREEMRWFAEESHAYPGEWVAIEGPRLVAHGKKLADVRAATKAAGARDPLFASVPSDTTPFGGW
jgi:hypothetical protein